MPTDQHRRTYIAISVVGLALYLWGFWGLTRLAALPNSAPSATAVYPVEFGEMEAGTREQVRFLAEGFAPGAEVRLRDTNGRVETIVLRRAHSLRYLILALTSGLFFWGVSTFVFATRAQREDSRSFFWCLFLYGLIVIIGGIYFPSAPIASSLTLGAVHLSALYALPVLFVRLALRFPRDHVALPRLRWLVPALSALAVGMFFWQWLNYLEYFRDPISQNGSSLKRPKLIADGLLVAQVVLGAFFFYSTSRRLEATREREQTRWLFWGFAIGVTPYVFLRTLPEMFGFRAPLGPEFDRIFEMAIPTACVFAVVRYRWLDIDIIIRRSLIYAILAALLVGVYAGIVLVMGQIIEGRPIHRLWILFLGLGIVAGVGFNAVRLKVGRGVDRLFFKIRYTREDVLRGLRREINAATSAKALCVMVVRALDKSLAPRECAIIVRSGDDFVTAGNLAPKNARAAFGRFRELDLPLDATLAAPNSTSRSNLESSAFDPIFEQDNIVLLRAIAFEPSLSGLLLLGAREAERRYISADLELLAEISDLTASALERMELSQAFVEESLAALRLDEMNRMKDDFLSRVAHDLRTPLASISWSTENLLDGVAGEISESQESYLRTVRTSVTHLNGLVRNLLELSRLEQGEPVELEWIELGPVLERARTIMTPIAEGQQQTIEMQVDPGPRRVHGQADRILELLINLLDNALKFSPKGATVDVRVPAGDGPAQILEIRDRGPGLGNIDTTLLFERYRQSKASPHSQRHGFGLGLHIASALLQHMGGEISASDHPEGGAVFRCQFRAEPDKGTP